MLCAFPDPLVKHLSAQFRCAKAIEEVLVVNAAFFWTHHLPHAVMLSAFQFSPAVWEQPVLPGCHGCDSTAMGPSSWPQASPAPCSMTSTPAYLSVSVLNNQGYFSSYHRKLLFCGGCDQMRAFYLSSPHSCFPLHIVLCCAGLCFSLLCQVKQLKQ